MDSILQFEIAGNTLWRILLLFFIILISLFIGKIGKMLLQKSSRELENRQRPFAAASLNALSRSILFLSASVGIALSLPILELKSQVAEISDTASGILLTIGIGYFLFWLVEIPSVWLAK
ncbi:MAG: hypothetical protein JW882_13035, partial [Deltaproteobacteria bacterium]|nr:hypothetical protein [Deltaproteobacteria bacterium]